MGGMHHFVQRVCAFLLTCAALLAPARADDPKDKDKKPEPPVVTEHDVAINGATIHYKATTGKLPLKDETTGKVKAEVFYIAYQKVAAAKAGDKASEKADKGTAKPTESTGATDGDKAGDKSASNSADKPGDARATKPTDNAAAKAPDGDPTRPITFAFNGGPGSSSVWLHMGALGPRRVMMGQNGEPLPPPSKLTDNESSWLDFTDLVFIDPVSTGFSRAAEGEDPHQFHGLREDIAAVGEFIRLYCVRENRWQSPKFLAGESYGTTRASGLASYLQNELGMSLNGIVLVSPVLNFQTLSFDTGNDTAYWLFLPTYTATAWYHKVLKGELGGDLEHAVAEAEKFAAGDYLRALAKGDTLSGDEKRVIARRVADFTGLSEDFVMRADLRIRIDQFTKELLRAQGRSVGRYDSRYKGIDRNGVNDTTDYDPSYAAVQGPFTGAFNTYIRQDLKFETDLNYEILTGRVHPWNLQASNRYAETAESLRRAMTENPHLKLLVCCGLYDLATPFFAADYTVHHLGLDASLSANATIARYQAGHMMYLRHDDLIKLRDDAARFYSGALK